MNLTKLLYIITIKNSYETLIEEGITSVLFPLQGYSIGFDEPFLLEEIPKLENHYLYLNRIINSHEFESLKQLLLPVLNDIYGFVVEDFGVYELLKEMNYQGKIILYQSHFGTNVKTINTNLKSFDSQVISTDITKKQILNILDKADKDLVVFGFGRIPAMYSRRTLLKNYASHFEYEKRTSLTMQESVTKKDFLVKENEYGTVIYNSTCFNGLSISHEKIAYYIVNPVDIDIQDQLQLISEIKNKKEISIVHDEGFLNQETIYRVKGGAK